MRLEKVSLGIVAVVVLVVLAVPFWRELALSQLRQSLPCRQETIWDDSVSASIPSPHPKTDAQLLKEHPNDFLLRLALAEEQLYMTPPYDPSKSKLGGLTARALLRDFSNRGVVYTLASELPEYADAEVPRRIEGSGYLPAYTAKHLHDPGPPTKKQIDGCLLCIDLLNKAIAADSGNGWFHYGKARYLYGLHRDIEAQSEIHQAAVAPRFTNYADMSSEAWDHLCDLRGAFAPGMRADKICAIPYIYLARARETARITARLAYGKIQHGNTSEGVRMVGDMTTSGHNMARNAPTLIQGLVGNAVTVIGTNAVDPEFDPKTKGWRGRGDAKLAHYSQFLISHGYPREAAVLDKQWQQMQRMLGDARRYCASDFDGAYAPFQRFPVAFSTATGAIAVILVFCALWAGTALLTARDGGRTLWDKRACVTSALLSSLILAPVMVDLISPRNPYWFNVFFTLPDDHPLRSIFLPH